MRSPNPAGRPKGLIDKRQKLTHQLQADAPAIAQVVIDAALGGDISAAGLVLSRVAPQMKPVAERVSFAFDASAPMTNQVESVLQAIADGNLSPDTGKTVVEAIGALASIKQMDELERRLNALETRNNGNSPRLTQTT